MVILDQVSELLTLFHMTIYLILLRARFNMDVGNTISVRYVLVAHHHIIIKHPLHASRVHNIPHFSLRFIPTWVVLVFPTVQQDKLPDHIVSLLLLQPSLHECVLILCDWFGQYVHSLYNAGPCFTCCFFNDVSVPISVSLRSIIHFNLY